MTCGKFVAYPRESDAVQTFVPPIVFGNAETRDSNGVIAHLRDLLFEGHATDEVADPLINWERGVHKFEGLRVRSLLRTCV